MSPLLRRPHRIRVSASFGCRGNDLAINRTDSASAAIARLILKPCGWPALFQLATLCHAGAIGVDGPITVSDLVRLCGCSVAIADAAFARRCHVDFSAGR